MEGDPGSLQRYLRSVESCIRSDRASLLARFILDLDEPPPVDFSRVDVPDARTDELENWLTDADRIDALEEAYFRRAEQRGEQDDQARLLADAVDLLEHSIGRLL